MLDLVHIEPYREAWRRRLAAERVEAGARAERARALAQELARLLRSEHGARRVWLIGSLARGDFGLRSDIDLVVEGIPPERFYHACARAQALAGDIGVDLAAREAVPPRLERALAREGVEL
jgi:predicted nucleotidyltransferase